MFTLKNSSHGAAAVIDTRTEKVALLLSLFLIAFGLGLIADGKKIYTRQLKQSQKVDYQATLNPFTK